MKKITIQLPQMHFKFSCDQHLKFCVPMCDMNIHTRRQAKLFVDKIFLDRIDYGIFCLNHFAEFAEQNEPISVSLVTLSFNWHYDSDNDCNSFNGIIPKDAYALVDRYYDYKERIISERICKVLGDR